MSTHHRAIVYLLTCLAGCEVWSTSKTTIGEIEYKIFASYKGWAALFQRALPHCSLNAKLLQSKVSENSKPLTKGGILRRFRDDIKAPLIRCSAEVAAQLDFSIGAKPKSGTQWIDVFYRVVEWLRVKEAKRKALDAARRKVVKLSLIHI